MPSLFLLPTVPPSSHVLLPTSFPAHSASLLLPSLFLLPTSFISCAPDYPRFPLILVPYSSLSLFCFPTPSWNILLPISFPACPASNFLLQLFCFPPLSSFVLLPATFLEYAPSYLLFPLFCFLPPASLFRSLSNSSRRLTYFSHLYASYSCFPYSVPNNLLGRFKFRFESNPT
jgi:hypothetical protein